MSRRVVWVSTSTSTRGGISTYVRTMQQTPLWARWGIRHVTTHRNGSTAMKVAVFALGAVSFLWQLLVYKPQVVHMHVSSRGSFARKSVLAWMAWAGGVPVVMHVHGSEFHEFYARSPRPWRAYIRATLGQASALIALGDAWARRLSAIVPQARIVVVPNAVRPAMPVAQPLAGQPVRVLFLGEIGDRKGSFTLIDAWRLVVEGPRWSSGAELVMAGDGAVGQARASVEELGLAGCVRVLGWVDPAEVGQLLRTSQILVLPSRNEGQPMAVLEAMANGVCVVTTAVGGLADLVDGDSGVFVPVDDVDALARVLGRLITAPEERAELGAGALRRVHERFDPEVTWRALDSLYEGLLR